MILDLILVRVTSDVDHETLYEVLEDPRVLDAAFALADAIARSKLTVPRRVEVFSSDTRVKLAEVFKK